MLEYKRNQQGELIAIEMKCDECGQMLRSWKSEDEMPSSYEEISPFAALGISVVVKVLFAPLPMEQSIRSMRMLGEEIWLFPLPSGGLVGYVEATNVVDGKLVAPKTLFLFCSSTCQERWVARQDEFDVVMYPQGGQVYLLSEAPENFPTIYLGNFLPTHHKRGAVVALISEIRQIEEVQIFQKKLPVRPPVVIGAGWDENTLLTNLTYVFYYCPSCGQNLGIVIDFVPSTWICPRCSCGIFVQDATHRRSDLPLYFDFSTTLNRHLYIIGTVNNDKKRWLQLLTECQVYNMADMYQGVGIMIMERGVDIRDIINLFWYAVQ